MTPKLGKKEKNILWFNEINIGDIPLVGGKNASLGEMYNNLSKKGVKIPYGFALTAKAYRTIIEENKLDKILKKIFSTLDVKDVNKLNEIGKKVRGMLMKSKIPKVIEKEVLGAYRKLSKFAEDKDVSVAVRSSATAEDLPDASFAGQQETYLNVCGEKEVLEATKKCITSLFTNRAISYRETKGFDHLSISLSVSVQLMVNSSDGASGVMFTLDTESGFDKVVLINSSYGLGEYVVKGRVNPDQFYIFKEGIKKGKKSIIQRSLGSKDVRLVYKTGSGTKQLAVTKAKKDKYAITDDEVIKLTEWGMVIEDFYKKPQDIEWAKDGKTGELFIVQARPETVKTREDKNVVEHYKLNQKGSILLKGVAIGQKIGAGKVRVINSPKEISKFKEGEVLVTRITDPDWEPIMRIASAIITEQGGKTSHAAIVSREMGVPCIVGVANARKKLKTGAKVTVSCVDGDDGQIYKGILSFEVKKIKIDKIPKTKTKVMMNVGDPTNAFALSFLPNDGIGLAREEFIIASTIRIHPLALLNFNKLKDKSAKKKIEELTFGYKNKADYFVDKLAEGIAKIAVSSYKNDVILRLSDFKSNEYASLIGGKEFEPEEENPMIGWRGASRYYSKEYKEAFGLECQAIKKVRNEWGLTNIVVMIPFCRTPEEGEKVIKTMAEFGLKQKENGLQVYVMCEIPSNVILAEEFAKIFDGFSIGTNDLTQLTLGVSRDSALVSDVYDENNKAIKTLIRSVIKVAHKNKKKIGICGQAPSDYPKFADFLVREGIDSISLNPDTVLETKKRIANLEKTLGKTGKKTNKKYLSFIGMIGLVASLLVGVGAGCDNIRNTDNFVFVPNTEITPAQIREKAEEELTKKFEEENNAKRVVLHEDSFAKFQLSYPSGWQVEHWGSGLTIHNIETNEYFSIFKQLVSHPISDEGKKEIKVSGLDAKRYEENLVDTTSTLSIVEFKTADGVVLEINGSTKLFDEILSSISFESESDIPDTGISHLDVREKRVCVQMATYARESNSDSCVFFSTPCSVPEDWEVCDADDLKN